jgi:hypothetical protein
MVSNGHYFHIKNVEVEVEVHKEDNSVSADAWDCEHMELHVKLAAANEKLKCMEAQLKKAKVSTMLSDLDPGGQLVTPPLLARLGTLLGWL